MFKFISYLLRLTPSTNQIEYSTTIKYITKKKIQHYNIAIDNIFIVFIAFTIAMIVVSVIQF